jgi:hypothetical protein
MKYGYLGFEEAGILGGQEAVTLGSGETNGVFTLTEFQVFVPKVMISANPKTWDMSDC